MKISFTASESGDDGAPPTLDRNPLRLLVFGQFAPDGPRGISVLSDASGFRDVLKKWAPQLFFEVPNLLSRSPENLEVRLTIAALRDFSPSQVIEALDLTSRANALWNELLGLRGQKDPSPALKRIAAKYAALDSMEAALRLCQKASATPVGPVPVPVSMSKTAAEADGSVSRLLDLIDLPGREEQAADAMGKVIGQMGRVSGKAAAIVDTTELNQAIEEVRRHVGRQLDAIFHHPQFQEAEAMWRGLKFFVDRIDFRQGIQLELYNLPQADLANGFAEGLQEAESLASSPLSAVFAAYGFSHEDAPLLQNLAQTAEAQQIPLLSSLSPEFLGLSDPDNDRPGFVDARLEKSQYVKYNSLRRKDCARWLAVAFNRFLLRAAHGEEDSQAPYAERCTAASDHLWGDPVWPLAVSVARSFAASGWPTEITGQDEGRIEDLPLRTDPRGRQLAIEYLLSQDDVRDLSHNGIIALGAAPNTDSAFISFAPTIFRTDKDEGRNRNTGSFPYQLMVARFLGVLALHKGPLTKLSSGRELQERLESAFGEIIADSGAGASVEANVQPSSGGASGFDVVLKLRTGRGVLRGVSLDLNFSI